MSQTDRPIAIDLNFDSLNEAYGFPPGFRDPSFFSVFDRFLALADRYRFKYSIYVVGKDLDDPEIFRRVKDWSQAGHEIGSHSWSHPMNLGALPRNELKDEVYRAHDIIHRCTGKAPRGFIAPAWATSKTLMEELITLGYLYDTSVFPSFLLYPTVLKIAANHLNNGAKLKRILNRKDWLHPFTISTKPFFSDSAFTRFSEKGEGRIMVFPLPTTNRFSISLWHTLGFIFGWPFAKRALRQMLEQLDHFYYLLHPGDLIGREDLEGLDVTRSHSLERMRIPLKEKTRNLEEMLDLMVSSGRPIMTMEQLARSFEKKSGDRSERVT